MKFGNRLLSELNYSWGPSVYIAYGALKKAFKKVVTARESVKPPDDVPETKEFLIHIENELEKVLAFYDKELGFVESLMAKVKTPSSDTRDFEIAYCGVKVFIQYCKLNCEGFSNINKKLAKHSTGRNNSLQASAALREKALSSRLNSKQADTYRDEILALYSQRYCSGNGEEALKLLEACWKQDARSQPRIASLEDAAFFRSKTMKKEQHYILRVLTGTSNQLLAKDICQVLHADLENARVGTFANGEIDIKLQNNVRGDDVFIVQTTCGTKMSPQDLNKAVMELLLLIHTLRLASAKRITAVVPYLAYSRQDRKTEARVPISCSAFAQMLLAMGMDRLVTVDLHCGQIQGFFGNTPVDNLLATKEFVKYIREKFVDMSSVCIVSPDAGGVERARQLADAVHAEQVVTILKRRVRANMVDSMQIVGDVNGRICIIIDDMIDTAGTLTKAANLLREHGCIKVIACATHGILTDPACQRINECAPLEQVVVTDSIPQVEHISECPKLHVLTLAPLLAEAIHRIHNENSLSEIFKINC